MGHLNLKWDKKGSRVEVSSALYENEVTMVGARSHLRVGG